MIAWFPFQSPPENCHVIYFDLYLLYLFLFFRFFICDYVIPVSPMTPNSNSILFFIFSLFFRFFICDYVIPVSPVTPNLNSSSEKRVWYLSCDFVIPISISTWKLPCYLFWFISSLYFLLFLDFSFVTTWSSCPPWLQV